MLRLEIGGTLRTDRRKIGGMLRLKSGGALRLNRLEIGGMFRLNRRKIGGMLRLKIGSMLRPSHYFHKKRHSPTTYYILNWNYLQK